MCWRGRSFTLTGSARIIANNVFPESAGPVNRPLCSELQQNELSRTQSGETRLTIHFFALIGVFQYCFWWVSGGSTTVEVSEWSWTRPPSGSLPQVRQSSRQTGGQPVQNFVNPPSINEHYQCRPQVMTELNCCV